jgi:DMSO reductase family type II enzyme chaperone
MDQTTQFTPDPKTSALARSYLYQLLSMLFRYPTVELFDSLANGDYLSELANAIEASPHHNSTYMNEFIESSTKLQRFLAETSYRDYEVLFTETFEVGAPKPPCPLYEGLQHKALPRNATMLNIAAFYKHFGLEIGKQENNRELPDHISAELEFLHFLTFKEAQAREEADTELLGGYVLAQNDFLQRHLLRWVPDFANELKAMSPDSVLAAWAQFSANFLLMEMDLVRTYLKELGIKTTPLDEPDEIPVTTFSSDELAPGCAACLDASPE